MSRFSRPCVPVIRNGDVVAEVVPDAFRGEWDDQIREAQLFAAAAAVAPDMLKLLESMVPLLNSSAGHRYRREAFVIIAKARGE